MVTIHRLRAPGLGWFRLPLFVWGMYATSIIQVLGTPVLAITVLLLAAERLFHIGVFDPRLGGDPVLFQHFFWFYSHPAVYIMILPAMGVISELVAAFARKRIFGYKFVAFASVAIAVLGFLVWAHHMFVAGISVYAAAVFSILTMLVAVPSAIKVFNWTATLYKGSISWQTPMLYALNFIGVFVIGGLTGTMLATLGLDAHIHDTYFLVAHFHYVMVGSAVMGYLGGIHYWWPKITGRMYNEFLSKIAAITVFVGFNVTFFPQFILGYMGMPRRYHTYPPEFQVLNVMSSAGATVLGARLSPSAPLPRLVAEVRQEGVREPVGRRRPRVGDDLPAADRQLRPPDRRDARGVRLPVPRGRQGGPRCRMTPTPRRSPASPTTSTRTSSRRSRPRSGCGSSSCRRSSSSAGSSSRTRSTAGSTRSRSTTRAATSTSCSGRSTPSS